MHQPWMAKISLVTLLVLTLLGFSHSAFAIPNIGRRIVVDVRYSVNPRDILGDSFANLMGRPLNRAEKMQVDGAVDEMESFQERPQKTSWIGDIISTTEVRPVVCLYGKVSGQILKLGSVSLGGLSGNTEIMPCLMLNSVNPFLWQASQFRSYVLQGFGFGPTPGYGGVSAGILMGAYMGPKNVTRPMVGSYYYARYTLDKGVAKLTLQVAYGSGGRYLILPGVGGELSFQSLLSTLKVLPKVVAQNSAPPAPGAPNKRLDFGVIMNIYQFPWFERLYVQRMSPLDVFKDVNEYIASNN